MFPNENGEHVEKVDAEFIGALEEHGMETGEAQLIEIVRKIDKQKDSAYSERNCCVSLLARMALAMGLKAGIARHDGADWEDDWRNIVFIDLPTGQVSWHFHDSEGVLFNNLPKYDAPWDLHSTAEKYRRAYQAFR